MSTYASTTTVPVAKSRAEIEATLARYGASKFMSGWDQERAVLAFEVKGRQVRFLLPIPDQKSRKFTHVRVRGGDRVRSSAQALAAWEQECRSRWRRRGQIGRAHV